MHDDSPLPKFERKFTIDYAEHPEVAKMSPIEAEQWRKENEITLIGNGFPNPILDFQHAPFPSEVISYLKTNYQTPTPIQSQSWPVVFSGRDMVGSAKTGSGKTIAFVLPALEHIRLQRNKGNGPIALILAPTRELVQQINEEIVKFKHIYSVHSGCFFGGQGNRMAQIRQVQMRPQIVVAAPGRLMDFVSAGIISLSNVSYFVLDEADRMLDMGFEPQIRNIAKHLGGRQTLMFSATWPKSVQLLCQDYLNNPLRVNIGSLDLSANPDVKQQFVFCQPNDRIKHLVELLKSGTTGKTLIFEDTKFGVDMLAKSLVESNLHVTYPFATLHGDKSQNHRNNIMEDFKQDKLLLVIATDVASRGLDVKDIETVINFSMPQNIENYIHRIGRTARAGKKGLSITYITPETNSYVIKDLKEVLTKANQPVPPEISHIFPVKSFPKPPQGRFPGSTFTPSSPPPSSFTPRMPDTPKMPDTSRHYRKPMQYQPRDPDDMSMDIDDEDEQIIFPDNPTSPASTSKFPPSTFRPSSSSKSFSNTYSNKKPSRNNPDEKTYKDPADMAIGSMASKLPPNITQKSSSAVPETFLKAKQYLEELKNREN
jgi:ATP-dependent RNA helicase DDX5/DBP2